MTSIPASSWSRIARSTASSSISSRSTGPNSPRSAAAIPATNQPGWACDPTTLVRSPSVIEPPPSQRRLRRGDGGDRPAAINLQQLTSHGPRLVRQEGHGSVGDLVRIEHLASQGLLQPSERQEPFV